MRKHLFFVMLGCVITTTAGGQPNVSERARNLSRQILSDIHGAAYYADAKILADLIKRGDRVGRDDENNAVEVIRLLLRGCSANSEATAEQLAATLAAMGVR